MVLFCCRAMSSASAIDNGRSSRDPVFVLGCVSAAVTGTFQHANASRLAINFFMRAQRAASRRGVRLEFVVAIAVESSEGMPLYCHETAFCWVGLVVPCHHGLRSGGAAPR